MARAEPPTDRQGSAPVDAPADDSPLDAFGPTIGGDGTADGTASGGALTVRGGRDPVAGEVLEPARGPLPERERDFMLLLVHVYLRHRLYDRASALVEALIAMGEDGPRPMLARAVIAHYRGDHEGVLDALGRLDRIDPIERYGRKGLTDRQRMRSYLRARALHELGASGRQALDLYIRHGGEDDGSSS